MRRIFADKTRKLIDSIPRRIMQCIQKKRWTDQLLDSIYRHYCVLLYLNLLFDIQAHIFAQQYKSL